MADMTDWQAVVLWALLGTAGWSAAWRRLAVLLLRIRGKTTRTWRWAAVVGGSGAPPHLFSSLLENLGGERLNLHGLLSEWPMF